MARPSGYDNLNKAHVEKLAKAGWTDKQMADFFGVTVQTWDNWKNKNPKFFGSLKDWKAEADHVVERSLYERATGYSHPDTHISNYQGIVTETPITKHYPPDTTAMIFWLKNRQPTQWRDKQDHELTGKDGGPVKVVIQGDDAGL
ncbi:MAG: hypothetical protein FKY71_16315 [Spiribacter salinus]|uniref:Terminase n=1 Tax=Spiribacter salinus TaxID=1335746 RepID=A0A540VK21_9GAMM|nr:MAG: hypothetical protein FKY71_16315 [Spiribacter salinus]